MLQLRWVLWLLFIWQTRDRCRLLLIMLPHRSVQSLHLLLVSFLIVFNHTLVKSYNAAHDRRLLHVTFGYGAPPLTVPRTLALWARPIILHVNCAVRAWPVKIVVRRRYRRGVKGLRNVMLHGFHHFHGERSRRSLGCTTKAASDK